MNQDMNNLINIIINDIPLQVEEGKTILEAAKILNIHIPVLCYHKDLCIAGNCRICVVEEENNPYLIAACAIPVREGMKIQTNTKKIRDARKHILELLLTEHNISCIK
jgi:NADH dehydrogenase/NADH:ubiquinone oxidoreductase subunit G